MEIRATLRRLTCPSHGVRIEGVPFARPGSDFTRDFTLKEALRAILALGLSPVAVTALIDRVCSRATSSRLKPFERLARTIRKHRDKILAAIRLKTNKRPPRSAQQ